VSSPVPPMPAAYIAFWSSVHLLKSVAAGGASYGWLVGSAASEFHVPSGFWVAFAIPRFAYKSATFA
jgi:hypothetical protein